MSPGRCLVLGGSGFIGSHLVELLLKDGIDVKIFSRSSSVPTRLVASRDRVELSVGDFHDAESLARAVKGCDLVYHLIATTVPTTSNRDMVFDANSNLIATLRLLEICVRENVRQIIFSSSGGTVYGKAEDRPIPEDHSTEPRCSYGILKVAIERYLELFRIQYGLDYTILRISNCYGPRLPINGEQGVVGVFLDRLRRGDPITLWGDGSIRRDYVYVTDVALALRAALGQRSPFKVFNIGTGIGTSLLDLIEMMERTTGCRFRILRQEAREVDVTVNILDASRARKYLSWEATTPLEQGLVNTWKWIQAGVHATTAHIA
jgi:UDP-glucose 4-epimerase